VTEKDEERIYRDYMAPRKKTGWDYIQEGRLDIPMSSTADRIDPEPMGYGGPFFRCCILVVCILTLLFSYVFLMFLA
jgi:hypothetical protein